MFFQNTNSLDTLAEESVCRLYEVGHLKDEDDEQVTYRSYVRRCHMCPGAQFQPIFCNDLESVSSVFFFFWQQVNVRKKLCKCDVIERSNASTVITFKQ